MKTAEIRQAFLKFFESKNHQIVRSSSLVPHDDPTLLFTNAGMNQFKDCFLGAEKRPYTRATTAQKCVRAGGKHNDLENVGYTARHHTFFEMMGNFSFGDYFKQDAIAFAWEFLTSAEWLNLPVEKLLVTIYENDDEAYDIWHNQIGIADQKIIRIGDNKGAPYASDNFWAMGDTGPCGPCTEVFYDHGDHIWGGPPGSPEEDGDRFIEIWNIVFMQFNRQSSGEMQSLPAPSVDTGMGLERISAILQGVHANYEIDLFRDLLSASAQAIGCTNEDQPSLRVVADHIRSCSFLIADGVMPSNEGRGYVLRRIIRRACRHGHKLGARGSFFHRIVAALVAEMGEAYPELKDQQAMIERVLAKEEEQFARTLEHGLQILEQDLAELKGQIIPGEVVFKLYDTYGFPVDLTGDIARERDLTLDLEGFESAMEAQRERARAASQFGIDYNELVRVDVDTDFTGYDLTTDKGQIVALLQEGNSVEQLREGDEGVIVLDRTPFYAESGGQVGDSGIIGLSGHRFEVKDTTAVGTATLHHGVMVEGTLSTGQAVDAVVDDRIRQATALNHSATHLLHAALRQVVGDHVQQKGSLVNSQRLRFDFSHFEALTAEELSEIETLVNSQVRANTPVTTELTDIETAKQKGAMALFGEKYGDQVRVLSMGTDHFSVELCGGTHVNRTGDIGLLHIISESGIASGVRRIEAITGEAALRWLTEQEKRLQQAAASLKAKPEQLGERLEALQGRNRELERELEQLKAKQAANAGNALADEAVLLQDDIRLLVKTVEGADGKGLRGLMDQLKQKLPNASILLAASHGGKVNLIAGVTGQAQQFVHAGKLVNHVAEQVGGRGGGRPDMAQAGGTDPAALPDALASVQGWVVEQMSQ